MFTRKPKQPDAVPMPAFTLNLPLANPGRTAIYDQLSGRTDGEIHNVAFCKLTGEVLLVRTYKCDPFRIVLRVGSVWHELGEVSASDPAVQALQEASHIVEHGSAPHEIEAQRKREAEKAALLKEEQDYNALRRLHRERLIEKNEAARLAALAARQ